MRRGGVLHVLKDHPADDARVKWIFMTGISNKQITNLWKMIKRKIRPRKDDEKHYKSRSYETGRYTESIAPWVPSPPSVVRKMLEFVELKPGETLYDLGCGDGRIVIMAAREFKAKGIGIDLMSRLIDEAVDYAESLGLNESTKFIDGNLFDVDLRLADVVTMYLLTSANEKIRPKLERELRSGARVVTHDFPVPGWQNEKRIVYSEESGTHSLYLYIR